MDRRLNERSVINKEIQTLSHSLPFQGVALSLMLLTLQKNSLVDLFNSLQQNYVRNEIPARRTMHIVSTQWLEEEFQTLYI